MQVYRYRMYITHIEAFCKRKATICPRNDTSEYGINSHCNQGKNQGRWTLGKHHMFAISKNYSYQELRFVVALWSEFNNNFINLLFAMQLWNQIVNELLFSVALHRAHCQLHHFYRHSCGQPPGFLRMQALHLLGILKEKQLQPNSITYCNTISACARCQDQMLEHCVLMWFYRQKKKTDPGLVDLCRHHTSLNYNMGLFCCVQFFPWDYCHMWVDAEFALNFCRCALRL